MNILRLTVPDPDELLAAGAYGAGALIRVQSGPTSGGAWANLTTALLVSGTYEYTAYDPAGTDTTWYQSRYENTGGTILSDWSAPFQASGASGYAQLGDAKRRLGIAGTDTSDDDILVDFINQASSYIESKTGRQFYLDPPDGTTKTYLFDCWDPAGNDGGPGGGMIVNGGKCLLVPRGIVSLTTLQVATFTNGPLATIPTTDWFLRPTAQETEPGFPFTEVWISNIPATADTTPMFYPGFNTAALTGVFGWATVPYRITDVCLNLVVGKYRGMGAGGGDEFKTGLDGVRTFERLLSSEDWRTLQRHTIKIPMVI